MTGEPTTRPTRRVLILADSAGVAEEFLAAFQERATIRVAHSTEEALAALRSEPFDLVVTGSSELLPLTRAAAHERASGVLEGIGQGVCIVTRDGRLVWANSTLRAYPPEVVEAIRQACVELLCELAAETTQRFPRVRQRALRVGSDRYFDLSVSALPGGDNSQIEDAIGLFSDTTEISRMRERLDAIDAAGRELVALDVDNTALLDVGERLRLLEERLIRYCRDLLDFTHFIVMVLDPQTRHLDLVLARGFSEQAKSLNIFALEDGNGISGYVAATGRSYNCPDIFKDPKYLPGIEHAASSLTVPLRLMDRVVGVFNVESDRPAAFTDTDRQFAEIFARYIAVALHTLKLLAVERYDAAGQVTADVAAEVNEPLSGIVAEACRLLAEAPSEDARRRLRTIMDSVDRVKRTLQTAGETPVIRGLMPETAAADPVLTGQRVLIVDDEEIIRETISDVLTKAGALPVTACDGDEAIAMLRSQPFDLVLSDIKMPNKNGYEVFAVAKEISPACPVILITGFGYDPEHQIVRASREGLAAVIFKPFKVQQLLDNMRQALGAAAPRNP